MSNNSFLMSCCSELDLPCDHVRKGIIMGEYFQIKGKTLSITNRTDNTEINILKKRVRVKAFFKF